MFASDIVRNPHNISCEVQVELPDRCCEAGNMEILPRLTGEDLQSII